MTAPKPISLAEKRKEREHRDYAALVLSVWEDMEHADKRELLDRKADVQIKARDRL